MLKIPTFIIGALLILTGLAGYLFQDLGLSLKLTGPIPDDAEFTLSDGNDSVILDLGFPSSKSAGEYAFWMVHRLNQNHAKDRSQANYAVEQGSTAYKTQSFWHASSKGDTQEALVLHAETGELGNLAETDAERSTVRLVYKNFTGNSLPVTLTSTNWTNIESKTTLKPGNSLQFYKSWTAFIPGILGIILIVLAQGAEMAPKARKHIMHAAVTVGLIGFVAVAKMLPKAVSEMNWLKGETYGIIQASSLKATTMLASAGLLLVFVILCVVSFISARKEMAAQAEADAEKKKKVLHKVKAKNEDTEDQKPDKIENDEKIEKSLTKLAEEDSKEEQKANENISPSTENPEPNKEPIKAQQNSSKPKKENKTHVEKKSSDAPEASDPISKSKKDEPNKTSSPLKDSSSSSDNSLKDVEDSKKERESSTIPETDENEMKQRDSINTKDSNDSSSRDNT